MKSFLKAITGMAALLILLAQPGFAQEKEKEKEKSKTSRNDRLIITRKSDKDAKVTIEIKGDEVLVNGKPADEYEDDNIRISKQRGVTIVSPRTPFRAQGGTWSFNGNDFHFGEEYAFLGVSTQDHDKGAKIESVTDESAAEKAGLKEGDIITKVDDSNIGSPSDLTKAITKHKPEEKATITYLRDGKEQKVTVTLGKRRGAAFADAFSAPHFEIPNIDLNFDNGNFGRVYSYGARPRLGVKAQDTEDGKGVKVIDIDEKSIAEKAGLKEGDIITEFDGKPINDTDALAKAARDAREKSAVTVKYNRDGKTQTVELKTPKKLKTTSL